MDISEALKNLDPENDEHWTELDLPNLATLEGFIGGPIKDEMLKVIAEYNRDKAKSFASSNKDLSDDSQDEKDGNEELTKELRSKANKLGASISKLNKNIIKIRNEISEKGIELSVLEAKIEELLPISTNQQEIMNYLKSENKQRLERHKNRKKILDNLSPADFPSASPLDLAMSRKTQRGTLRPGRV